VLRDWIDNARRLGLWDVLRIAEGICLRIADRLLENTLHLVWDQEPVLGTKEHKFALRIGE
jgi:hypothetical protein